MARNLHVGTKTPVPCPRGAYVNGYPDYGGP